MAGRDQPILERPELHLSGPRLRQALESLIAGSEEQGGVERYVEALKLKTASFQDAFADGAAGLQPAAFKELCSLMPSVRRRIAPYLDRRGFAAVCTAIGALLEGRADTTTADARLDAFERAFPRDRDHRWVRDLAAELLHNIDPERYPLMQRWVWNARTNTGALREIWWADNVDHIMIDVPDSYGAFLIVLREELSQFLTENGVFRDILQYVDLVTRRMSMPAISASRAGNICAPISRPRKTRCCTPAGCWAWTASAPKAGRRSRRSTATHRSSAIPGC